MFQSTDGQDIGIDAGVTPQVSLTPNFTLLPIACGETKITPTNVSIFLDDAAPSVALYRWVLFDPEGIEIHSSLGPPEEPLDRSARVLGGTVEAPEFNLTLYRGKQIGLFTRTTGGETPSLLQHLSLSKGTYELEAVVGLPATTNVITTYLRNSDPFLNYGNVRYDCEDDETCGTLQYIRTVITTNSSLPATDPSSMLQLVFSSQGAYFVDGVRLRSIPGGEDLIQNDSFEQDVGGWSVGNGQSGNIQTPTIPDEFAEYGVYTLEFNAVDSEGTEGPVLSKNVEHYRCN